MRVRCQRLATWLATVALILGFPAAGSAQAPPGLTAPPRRDLRIVVISDLNSAYGSTSYEAQVGRAIALIPAWKPDLVLSGGDMVAGQKTALSDGRVEAMWQAFDRQIFAPLRRSGIPFGFTLGNHDGSGERAFRRDRTLATAFWNDPAHDPGLTFVDRSGFPFYYSFVQQGVFFLVWDATTARIPSDVLAWAERSLASPVARRAKMRIAVGHLPLFGVAIGREKPGNFLDRAENLRALLERHGVHTYVSGHDHAYYPAHRGRLHLLHAGALGAGPRRLIAGKLPPWHSLTVIDIDTGRSEATTTTYDLATLAVFDERRLPRLLASPHGMVLRRDVEWSHLDPAEQDACRAVAGARHCGP